MARFSWNEWRPRLPSNLSGHDTIALASAAEITVAQQDLFDQTLEIYLPSIHAAVGCAGDGHALGGAADNARADSV